MAREYKKGVKAEKKKGLSIREKRKKTSELVFKGINDGKYCSHILSAYLCI